MNYNFPLKSWIVDILNKREGFYTKQMQLNKNQAFVIMSSSIKLVKKEPSASKKQILEQISKILKEPEKNKAEYEGCIIVNNANKALNYNEGKTVVGWDFNGTPIVCDGESSRRISPVIIESLEVKGEGTGQTIKTASVRIRCFSLHQLELVEQFFLQPGTNVVIEFGDNSNYTDLMGSGALIPKNNHKNFVNKFLSDYRIPTPGKFKEYLEICSSTGGTYDRFAGQTFKSSYSIEPDGSFLVNVTYIQGNEISYQMPINLGTAFGSIKIEEDPKPSLFDEILIGMANDMPGLNYEFLSKLEEKEWKDEFFNFETYKNTSISEGLIVKTPYVSLKFILEVLVNNAMSYGGQSPEFTFQVPNTGEKNYFKVGDSFPKIIPIKIHKHITSFDTTILYPNKEFPLYGIDDKGRIVSNTKNLIDASINGKSVVVKEDVEFVHPNSNEKIVVSNPFVIGNALNIFIDYNEVITKYRLAYNRIDFIAAILQLINERSFGIFKLIYGNLHENSTATIIDFKLYSEYKNRPFEIAARTNYRFKPLSKLSIVRDFQYTFEMDEIMFANAILNANSFVAQNKYAADGYQSNSMPFMDRVYGLSSYANHTTIDGYYAIDQIKYDSLTDPETGFKEEEVSKEEIELSELHITDKGNLKAYLLNPKDEKSTKYLVVANPSYLYSQLMKEDDKYNLDTQLLSNIKITFTIDGLSGFNVGETFEIDGVPEMRNKIGQFRIENWTHLISNNVWITQIEARWAYKILE
jgi:hypothetical protein